MTVVVAARHAWMPVYCTGCEQIVHFQKEDVMRQVGEPHKDRSNGMRFVVTCRCGDTIVIAKR